MKSLDLSFKQVDQVINFLKAGKIGVIPTDTIYGIVGLALNPKIVAEIYKLRKRSLDKPMIILISSMSDLSKFEIIVTKEQELFLEKIWPNPVSIILSVFSEKFNYLHRGKYKLAFRMPKNESLLQILRSTGPLVAPSANFEGEKNAENIENAKSYFGDNISFYLDDKEINSKSSTLIELDNNGHFKLIREGAFILPRLS